MRSARWPAMTGVLLTALLVATGPAAADSTQGFKDGKFTNEYFGITYEAEGLQAGDSVGGPQLLFSGKLPSGAQVEVSIFERGKELTAKEWVAHARKVWSTDGRARTDWKEGSSPTEWVTFVYHTVGGFEQHTGVAFYPRGYQCFVVHAWTKGGKTATSGAELEKAISGLKVSPRDHCYMLAYVIALRDGSNPADPIVLFKASARYGIKRYENPKVVLGIIDQLEQNAMSKFNTGQKMQLATRTGVAWIALKEPKKAIQAFNDSLDFSRNTQKPQVHGSWAHYNLACAYSLAKDTDMAFQNLRMAFDMGDEKHRKGIRGHAAGDKDFDNIREDPRWKQLLGHH